LFTPCRSTKGGSGLGLAISQQMAHQLGAKLELKRSGPDGCVFALTLPRLLLAGEGAATADGPAPERLASISQPAAQTGSDLARCVREASSSISENNLCNSPDHM